VIRDILGDIAMQRSISNWTICCIDSEQQYLMNKDSDQLCEIYLDLIGTRRAQIT
jgi:hypothetical protein